MLVNVRCKAQSYNYTGGICPGAFLVKFVKPYLVLSYSYFVKILLTPRGRG